MTEKHTVGAMRAAEKIRGFYVGRVREMLAGGDFEYCLEMVEDKLASIIDKETGAAELLEALKLAIEMYGITLSAITDMVAKAKGES